jgi:hypothetical protein
MIKLQRSSVLYTVRIYSTGMKLAVLYHALRSPGGRLKSDSHH